ncbi:MAG: hypothetical protein M9916_08985 [Crocinitomicaceae bacterium]|nr:hypothetical protein [Crocinitomicaceae bacterium]
MYLSQKELLKKIEENLTKLEAAELNLTEIENHLQLVRELYDRTIVLRYKAFEIHSSVEVKHPVVEEVAPFIEAQEPAVEDVVIHEEEMEEDVHFNEPEEEEEEVKIDFDIFDIPSEEPAIEEDFADMTQEEAIDEESEDFQVEEPVFEQEPVAIAPIEASVEKSGADFATIVFEINRNVKNQVGFTPLSSLVGSFGLNERLMFINELFDGSSESFSDAVKFLDSRSSLSESAQHIDELGRQFNWEPENEALAEFIQKLCRRFD